jgi:hypothetical protein
MMIMVVEIGENDFVWLGDLDGKGRWNKTVSGAHAWHACLACWVGCSADVCHLRTAILSLPSDSQGKRIISLQYFILFCAG